MEKYLSKKHISLPLAFICTMLWGTAFPVIKKCYSILNIDKKDYGTEILFAGCRFLLAGLIVLFLGSFFKKTFVKIKGKELLPIFILGTVQIFGQYFLSYIGLASTSGTNTSVITSLGAFLSVIFAPLFFKSDALNVQKIAGCIIGFLGVLFINTNSFLSGSINFFGDGLIFLSTISATAGSIISKIITPGKSFFTVSAYHQIFGGVILILAGLLMGGFFSSFNILSSLLLLYLALVSAVSFTIWTALLRYNLVSRILVFNLLIPVFGTIWSAILLGEQVFKAEIIISLLLICAGIALVNMKGRKENEN